MIAGKDAPNFGEAKNSWGDGFGENGIFYVSYYDTNIGTHNVAYTLSLIHI